MLVLACLGTFVVCVDKGVPEGVSASLTQRMTTIGVLYCYGTSISSRKTFDLQSFHVISFCLWLVVLAPLQSKTWLFFYSDLNPREETM